MREGDPPQHPKPMTEEQIMRVAVGLSQKQLSGKVVLVDYDPAWPRLFLRESDRINSALGRSALAIEHVGSTSVPGLAAKPIIEYCSWWQIRQRRARMPQPSKRLAMCSGSENPNGTSIECSRVQTRTSTFTCSARVTRRLNGC